MGPTTNLADSGGAAGWRLFHQWRRCGGQDAAQLVGMLQRQPQDSADRANLRFADGGPRGERKDASRYGVGHGQAVAEVRKERGVRLHAMTAGIKIAPR